VMATLSKPREKITIAVIAIKTVLKRCKKFMSDWSVKAMVLDEWISRFDNEEMDKLTQNEQIEIRDMLIELLKYRVKFGGVTVKEIVKYLDIHQAECEERERNDSKGNF
jgi:hypothetical protein